MAALRVQHDARIECIVPKIVDQHVGDVGAQLAYHRAEQIVREGALHGHFLQFQRDSIGLIGADPDREIALGVQPL